MSNEGENDNGNGGVLRGMTPWMRFVAMIGAPSALAGYIVWSDRTELVTRLDAQAALIEIIKDAAVAHYQHDAALDAQILEATRETNRIVLAECLNNAKRNPDPNEAWDRCIGK